MRISIRASRDDQSYADSLCVWYVHDAEQPHPEGHDYGTCIGSIFCGEYPEPIRFRHTDGVDDLFAQVLAEILATVLRLEIERLDFAMDEERKRT